jgi:tight adherence protein C
VTRWNWSYSLTVEVALFGLLIGIFIAIIGLMVHQKFQTSPAKRLFPEAEARTPTEKVRQEIISAQMAKKLKNILGFTKDPLKAKELKQKLVRAGYYGERAITNFVIFKVVSPILLPLLMVPLLLNLKVSGALKPLLMYAPIILGFYLPNLVVNHQIQARQKNINEGLPDALDLLVVCVEAGLGLNAAIKRVADDCKVNNPVLSQEFTVLNLEILAGLDREQALRNLAERTGVEDLSTLCAILIQADRFGTSIATALRVQSDTLRTTRRQKLEEKAAQTAVKLIFPLLLFIFPALMVVIIGPAIIQVMETMIKK